MVWHLNRALTNLRSEVNAVWPDRDRTSDGTIGDLAHQATNSDHNPDPDGTVDAWDMDIDGVDVWHIIDRFEKHEAARYWIYNRQIATRSNGWRRERYTGANPHDKHVHFNTREGYENSSKPWGIGEGTTVATDMTQAEFTQFLENALNDPEVKAKLAALSVSYPVYPDRSLLHVVKDLHAGLAVLNLVASKVDLDPAEVSAIADVVPTPQQVAAAVLDALGAQGDQQMTPAEIANLLRPVLGDQAAAVGQALLQG
jgi:hypothetical protein